MEATDNLILAALPAPERQALLSHSRIVPLVPRQVLYELDAPVTTLHFPLKGALSLMMEDESGGAIEPAIIGREGVLGFPIGLGEDVSRWRSVVQLPGEAVAVSRTDVIDHISRGGALAVLMNHYCTLLVTFVAQSALCNRFHDLDARVARALLMMHDRAESERFEMTHETLGNMVGAQRPSVAIALNDLEQAEVIGGRRGIIEVLDRVALEAASCDCYERVRLRFDERVYGSSAIGSASYEPGEVNRG